MTRFVVQDCDALTADGGIVRIRPAADADTAAIGRLFDAASPESLRLRFFATPGRSVIATETTACSGSPAT